MDINQRRPRRTNKEIEHDILEAARKEIEDKGFAGLTVIGISKRAEIEPSVFYKRFTGLHGLLERYIQEYDYWYSSLFSSFDSVPPKDYVGYIQKVSATLIPFFAETKSMQELILWELTVDNDITRSSNQLREDHTKRIVETLHQHFEKQGVRINFRVFTSIFLSSVYFLIAHKGKATFCGIDFSTNEGQQLLSDTIHEMIKRLFEVPNSKREVIRVAEKMKSKGIAIEVIAECTGLSTLILDKL